MGIARYSKRKTNRRRPAKSKATFSKRVLSVVNGKRELKVAKNNLAANTSVEDAITQPFLIKLMPDVVQGVKEYERIGSSITLMKLVVRGYYTMTYPDTIANNNRCMVRHMVLKQRNCESADQLIAGGATFAVNNVLENSLSYLGSIQDFLTPVNKSAFIVRKDMKKIITQPSLVPGAQTGVTMSDSYWMYEYTLSFGKGKELNYRTSGANQPADFPYFIANSAAALGSNIAIPATNVRNNMVVTAYYYD